jgi:Autophagy protein Atg8 ubiquitin like
MDIHNIRDQYDGKVPVVIIGLHDVWKFLVPESFTLNQLVFYFRQKLKLESKNAIYVEIEGMNFISFNAVCGDLYRLYKSNDDCLYLRYSTEACFGL